MSDDKPGIEPLGAWILIRLVQAPKQTASGLVVPDSAKSLEGVARARVYASGPRCTDAVKPGTIVVVGQAVTYPVLDDGKQYLLVNEESIVGIDHSYVAPSSDLVVLQ